MQVNCTNKVTFKVHNDKGPFNFEIPQSQSDTATIRVLANNETDRYFKKETLDVSARSDRQTELAEGEPNSNYVEFLGKTVTFHSTDNAQDSILMNSFD